jgi:hypothetical protein
MGDVENGTKNGTGVKSMTRFFWILAFSILLAWPVTGMAQQYTKDNFAGMGLSAGQAARMADRANQSSGGVNTDTFRGMGINRGSASRGADRANSLSGSPSYGSSYGTSSDPYGSPNTGSSNSLYGSQPGSLYGQ